MPRLSATEIHTRTSGVINIISEDFIEASNATSINAPYGVSEFPISGLHPVESRDVKAPRVKEAVFSIEAKLVETREYKSPKTGKVTCTMAVVEGVRFWAREDAVNEERNLLDINVSLVVALKWTVFLVDQCSFRRADFELAGSPPYVPSWRHQLWPSD